MSHLPVNHHLRPLYRALGTITGLYVLGFGVVGLSVTRGTELFARGDTTALGLRTNLAFSVLSIAAGVIIVLASAMGRNIDRMVFLIAGPCFLAGGTVMMVLIHTDSNVLNFSIGTCIVSYLMGMVQLAAGLYGKVGPVGHVAAEVVGRT